MRKTTIVLVIAILFLTIVLSLSVDVHLLDRIEKGSSLISALASVITLFLALLLFEKYGVEQNVLEKNIDRIEKLTEEMRKISLQFEVKNHWFQLFPLQKEFYEGIAKHSKKIKKYRIIVNQDYADGLNPVTVFATDPFLPQEIAQAIKKINFVFGTSVKDKKVSELADTIKLRITSTINAGMQRDDDFLLFNSFKPDSTITLEEYINLWRDLTNSIQKWMKKHSNIKLSLRNV